MNQNLLYILVFAVFIYIVLDNSKETFYESFMPHDPSYYIDSCRRLTQEQTQVQKLKLENCNKKNITRKDTINSNINCHDLSTKEIMLNNEQPTWCSKITSEQLESIKQEPSVKLSNSVPENTSHGSISLFEGPYFLENDF